MLWAPAIGCADASCDGHALEHLTHGRTVHGIALGAALQLVDESFEDRGHVASLVAGASAFL